LTPQQQPKIERQYAQNPVMEVNELFRDLKFEFLDVQHFPHYMVQCSVEIESETFKGKDSSKKEAKFLAASAAIQRLKETGRYDELRAQIAEKREERRKQRELKQKEIWENRDKTTEEGANKYHIMNYFYKRHKEAVFNLRSYKNNEENNKWEMSVAVDDTLFTGTGQSDQAAKRAAAQSVLRYEVEIGAITEDITQLLNQDPNNPIKVPVEGVAEVKQDDVNQESQPPAEVKQDKVNQESQPPSVAEVKQDEVNQEPQPPGVAEVKQDYGNWEPHPPGVAEVKQDEVKQEPQPPGVAEVKQDYGNWEPHPPGVAEVKQDEVNEEPQPPGVFLPFSNH